MQELKTIQRSFPVSLLQKKVLCNGDKLYKKMVTFNMSQNIDNQNNGLETG